MSADHLTGMLAERSKAHGDFRVQFAIAQDLKNIMIKSVVGGLSQTQREALEMILVKISRILAGHSGTVDHWDDIAGYATLIANSLRPAPTEKLEPKPCLEKKPWCEVCGLFRLGDHCANYGCPHPA